MLTVGRVPSRPHFASRITCFVALFILSCPWIALADRFGMVEVPNVEVTTVEILRGK